MDSRSLCSMYLSATEPSRCSIEALLFTMMPISKVFFSATGLKGCLKFANQEVDADEKY